MSGESSCNGKQGRVRVKYTRRVSAETVVYPISLPNTIFRWDSICICVKKMYGNKFSAYQMKVLMCLDEQLKLRPNEVSLSYMSLSTSGMLRGMLWQEILRSLEILDGCGMLVRMGRTQGDKHWKYHLSEQGESLLNWVDREMSQPVDVLKVNSKTFNAPVPRTNQVA